MGLTPSPVSYLPHGGLPLIVGIDLAQGNSLVVVHQQYRILFQNIVGQLLGNGDQGGKLLLFPESAHPHCFNAEHLELLLGGLTLQTL